LQDTNDAVALQQPIPNCEGHSTELLTQIVRYIIDHSDVDLSVSAVARRFSLEEGVLLSAFRLHTGITLDHFVLRRCIERALYLLKNSTANDSDIAARIGWETVSDFQVAFFNCLGVWPTEYRRGLPPKPQAASREERKRPSKSAGLRGKNLV
jgi:two-component system, response regulator YesN